MRSSRSSSTTRGPEPRVGTSGWSYDHWHGPFYPPALKPAERLVFYANQFDTVEINNTFYRLPSEEAVRHWSAAVPPGFHFSIKASRYITHVKRLRDPVASLQRFAACIAPLQEQLGCVLFQLPPRFRCDIARLEPFLATLDAQPWRCAIEFRDTDWFRDEVYALLERRQVAWCIYELAGVTAPSVVTARHVYLRLHGPGGAYQGSYSDSALRSWAKAIDRWRGEGREVFCYFDNDEAGYAVHDALRLKALLEKGE